jgi:hypothetical protein
MKKFLFFRGFVENDFLDIDWDAINRLNNLDTIINPITTIPMWTGTTYTPTWVVNPGLITYTPGYHGTITTTPNYYGTGYITIPCNGTITTSTSTGFSLTTSNTNGTTYTTANFGGTLTTGTSTYTNSAFTTNFK